MKILYTALLLLIVLNGAAQWSDTTNQFTDSLHMPACIASGSQVNSQVIKSYPDSGYIIFWEDGRTAGNSTDIYAQKYDKTGVALWAVNGVPVATGTGVEQIAPSSNGDYRNYSHAATDSAGGFFITYQQTTQIGSYNRAGIAVQHINTTGNALYAGAGFVIAQPLINGNDDYGMPQLVADGKNGFYVSYASITNGYANYVYVHAYRLNGNAFQLYAYQRMNEDAYQVSDVGICGSGILSLQYRLPALYDYQMWADGQGGCNVIMNMSASDGVTNAPAHRMLAYNALKRVKKSCTAAILRRNSDIANTDTEIINYQKDSVIRLYNLQTFFWAYSCSAGVYTNYQLENFGLGYTIIADDFFDAYFTKGVTATTPGNINVAAVATSERQYINSQLTPFITKMYTWPEEIYDSIPYQRTSSTQLYRAYQIFPPAIMNKLNFFQDTVLNTSTNFHELTIATTGNKIYATARLSQLSGVSHIYLQQLKINRITADSFAISYNTPAKTGVLIGKEKSTGFTGSDIFYDNPRIATDDAGNALFYIRDYYSTVRVSPIVNATELAWGAMGRPLGSGIYNNGIYNMNWPFVVTYKNGTGIICWDDQRTLNPNTGNNIFTRHLDNLNVLNYSPPLKTIQILPFGNTFTLAAVLIGSSKKWSNIDANVSGNTTTTPVAQILDDYNLGAIDVNVYQHVGPIRTFNAKPYLNRNYTIRAENNPAGAATINLRLFFTTAEFDALKAADATIINPGFLSVIKQPNSTNSAPAVYTPIAGETEIIPLAWSYVDGGYYIEIAVTGFSNFFIQKSSAPLPVKWLGVQAQRQNSATAKISWQVADQINVKDYTVQHSTDGVTYQNVCTVPASNISSYHCVVAAGANTKNYYRVVEVDLDGNKTYSKTVVLQAGATTYLSIYPNPVKDKLYVDGTAGYKSLKITDAAGKIIYQRSGLSGLQFIDLGKVAPGLYFLTASGTGGNETVTFIRR